MNNLFSKYDQTIGMIENRISETGTYPKESYNERDLFIKLLGMLDMTTLEGSDNTERVIGLCNNSRFSVLNPGYPDAAAVCVYPSLVSVARKSLQGSGIRVASVAGGFPAGQTSLRIKMDEIRYALDEGADEIDTVISRGKLIEGSYSQVYDELSAMRESCGSAHLKVILETGELPSVELVRKASEISILAGADFIKSSTGKINIGATPAAFLVMLDTIREYLEKTGKTVGIKAAGGIRTPAQALQYAALFSDVMGKSTLSKDYFRIGASSLAGEILKTIVA
jgi:deoxyribose-phosphate aldolase